MSTVLEEFVGKLGWQVDSKGPAEFKKQTSGITAGIAKISAAYTAVAGVVTGFIVKTNEATAVNYRLAQSLGVSYDWLDRWGDATEKVGIGTTGIKTAMGFLNKTLGAVKVSGSASEIETLNENLRALGLSYSDVASVSASDAFNKIAFAIGNTEDRTVAATAASKLFGRGSGMAFARLGEIAKANGQTIEQYLNRFGDLEFETEQSAAGAERFAETWNALAFALDEIKAAFAGLIGEALTPMLKDVRGWIAANRELLKQKIVEWARAVAMWLKDVWGFISKIVGVIGKLITAVGGLGSALKIIVFFYLGSKFIAATKNVDDLGAAFGKVATKAQLAAAKANILKLGLLAVAAVAFDDLLQSLDDVSNESWGNKIARMMLRLQDEMIIGLAEFSGAKFKNAAEKANFVALIMAENLKSIDKMKQAIVDFGKWIRDHVPNLTNIKTFLFGAGGTNRALTDNPVGYVPGQENPLNNLGKGSYNRKPVTPETPAAYQTSARKGFGAGVDFRAPNAVTQTNTINVHPAPGMDEKKLAKEVGKHLEKHMTKALRTAEANGVAR